MINEIRFKNQPLISVDRQFWLNPTLNIEIEHTKITNDTHKCIYCDFISETNKVILQSDKSKQVICSLCLAVYLISETLLSNKGTLVIAPEMTQTEINNLFRYFFIANFASKIIQNPKSWFYQENSDTQKKISDLAQYSSLENKFRKILLDRGEVLFRKIFDVTVPLNTIYPKVLSMINSKTYENRSKNLSAIKLIPEMSIMNDSEYTIILKETNFSSVIVEEFYSNLGNI